MALVGAWLTPSPSMAGEFTLVSARPDGQSGNAGGYTSALSADGRYVAFESASTDLVPGDANGTLDIFVRDLLTSSTERVSLATDGQEANGLSVGVAISADGSRVAFSSLASNLVQGDFNRTYDVFVRDRTLGTTTRVSVTTDGHEGNNYSREPSISADGTRVAFSSLASNFVHDRNTNVDVFLRDLAAGTTVRASIDAQGRERWEGGEDPFISGDGSAVAFVGQVDPEEGYGWRQVQVYDVIRGRSTIESVTPSGALGDDDSWWFWSPQLSFDGNLLTFPSFASDLTADDGDEDLDVFVRNRMTATTRLLSSRGGWAMSPAISADGRSVAFIYDYSDPVTGIEAPLISELVLVSISSGIERSISGSVFGIPTSWAYSPAISADGAVVTFASFGARDSREDRNTSLDVYAWGADT